MVAQRFIRITQDLYAQMAQEPPPTRRALIAILLVLPGGLGIVCFYLLLRSLRPVAPRQPDPPTPPALVR